MELRSSRSRSRTPFLQKNVQEEVVESDNHIEEIVRTTRSSVTVKTYLEGGGSSVQMSKPTSIRRSKRTRIKTSDYSSEDGDGEITSSSHLTDNIKNQLKEEVLRSADDRSKVSALKLYKDAGEYWNKFPKTDYTYSRHSKDRVELAPGVVAMPNMSRRSLHTYNGSQNFTSHKQTSTESFEEESQEEEEEEESAAVTYSSAANHISYRRRPRTLFTNNNYEENHEYVITRSGSIEKSIVSRFLSVFVSIITFVFYPAYYVYTKQHSVFLWLGKKLHKFVSRIMLLDTWLLRRSHSNSNKLAIVCALCLIPLMFFGGWWLIHGISQHVYEAIFNTTVPAILSVSTTEPSMSENLIQKVDEEDNFETGKPFLSEHQLQIIANSIKNVINQDGNVNVDLIVEKVLQSSDYKKMATKYKNLENDINSEVDKIHSQLLQLETARNDDFMKIMAHIRSENSRNNAFLMREMQNCCRRYFIHIEDYITKILKDLLGAPSYVANQQDMTKWLHSIFVAKQDLEARLNNLTLALKSNYNALLQSNGNKIMDEVTRKISLELNKRLDKIFDSDAAGVNLDSLSDEHVKSIVHEALAIYDADKTGLVDFALESAGGQVISTRCTEPYQAKTAVLSIFGIPIWSPTNTPRTVITPGVTPGECWSFQNFPGHLVLKLSARIVVEAFSLEHVSKRLMSNGKITSAPKNFEVYGLRSETDDETVLLGKYRYDDEGEPLQYFPVDEAGLVLEYVELRILSNHGNLNYTCLYRFRVHGTFSDEPT